MCYFITTIIPRTLTDELRTLVPRGFTADFYDKKSEENSYITREIPDDFTQVILTSGGCACDLYQSRAVAESEDSFPPNSPLFKQRNPEKLLKKYRKKNWSRAKIERALAAISASQANVKPMYDEFSGFHPKIREIIATFTEKYGSIFIFVHFYSGQINTEKITFQGKKNVTVNQFLHNDFIVDEDVLYTIKYIIKQ
ncbi:MAG: hypothetical protein Q4C70_04795 [Planctomycetia bacterium]|nr:hypothetical protein [Planctomycetia bacterium]